MSVTSFLSSEQLRYRQAKHVTLVGAFANAVLAVVKIIFGILGQSHALLADGVHSFSDLLIDGLVLFASRFGSRQADMDHPYGHRRIETAATLALSLILILAGIVIIYDSGLEFFKATIEKPKFYILLLALLSVIINEILYHYTLFYSKRLRSNLLRANAWHHRSDAASSLVVFIGVAGSILGYLYLDPVAAVIVGLMIINMGAGLAWSSVRELVDTGVDEETLKEIRNIIFSTPGVQAIHMLRTRSMADNILIDLHILVDPKISVSEGHYIATQVTETLKDRLEHVIDVTVHVDSENDEIDYLNTDLPPREQLVPELLYHWQNCLGVNEIKRITLHYLFGKIEVELLFPLSVIETIKPIDLEAQYKAAVKQYQKIDTIKIYFSNEDTYDN